MKKKLIAYGITCVIIAVLTILAIKYGADKDETPEPIEAYRFDSDLSTDPQKISNGIVSLEFYPETTNFIFTDKYGNQWTGYPADADSSGFDITRSLMVIEYKNYNGLGKTMGSYEYCVKKGTYTYEVLADQNTIRLDLSIGLLSKTYLIPAAMPEEMYEDYRSRTSKENAANIRDWYKCYNPEKLRDKEEWAELSKKYPDLEAGKKVYEAFSNLKNWQLEKLEDAFLEMGYTREDYERDLEYANAEETNELKATFNISMYLKLDGDSLVAEVPFDEIDYYEDFPITTMQILPYMCASGLTDEGYLFVPDGSGAIIRFNNGKISSSAYSAGLYGWDYGQSRKEVVNDPITRFPVYGIAFENREASLLCMVEDGSSYARILADISGKSHNYNYVTNEYTLIHSDLADIAGRSLEEIYIYQNKLPAGEKLSVRVQGVNSSSYVDMAKDYRNYLMGRYPELSDKVTKTDLPTAVELIGSIIKVQHVLGFPKDLPYALTTYDEMNTILKDLKDSGWEGLNVVLNGWFNRGVVHDWPNDVDLIRKLGRKKDFTNLLNKAAGYGYSVSGKAEFQFVYNNKMLDSFVARRDASRFLSNEVAGFHEISDVWFGEDKESDTYYYARPGYSAKAIESYLKDVDKLGIKNIAWGSIGGKLGSDYRSKDGVSREAVLNQHQSKLAELKDRENVVYNGNEYTVPYADLVINFPIHADGTSIEDESIPFFPIALHGYVRYTGDSVNITNDYVSNLLNSAETGAGLYFIFMDATGDELQESDFTYYFGANYDSWKDAAKTLYNRYKSDFGNLTTETIENHIKLDDSVYCTVYSNGTKVYVNYRTFAYTTKDGVTIPAQDWVVVKGGN